VHDGHRGPKEIGGQPEFLAWLTDAEKNGAGTLFDVGCYGANLMIWPMDDARPIAVTAVTQQIKPEVYLKVDDEATIILEYPKAQAIIQASWNRPFRRKDMDIRHPPSAARGYQTPTFCGQGYQTPTFCGQVMRQRAVLTHNHRDFKRLHRRRQPHDGSFPAPRTHGSTPV
jgi:predicted dehydrogenase